MLGSVLNLFLRVFDSAPNVVADRARMAFDVRMGRVFDDAEIFIFRQFLQLENDFGVANRNEVVWLRLTRRIRRRCHDDRCTYNRASFSREHSLRF